jgi:hypothetical protein
MKTLLKPQAFITAYPKILREVNRRLIFNKFIVSGSQISKLNEVIAQEMSERASF